MPVNPFQIWNGIALIISSHCGVSFLCRFIQHKEPEHCSIFTRHGLGVGDTTHGVVLQLIGDIIPHQLGSHTLIGCGVLSLCHIYIFLLSVASSR